MLTATPAYAIRRHDARYARAMCRRQADAGWYFVSRRFLFAALLAIQLVDWLYVTPLLSRLPL